MSRRAPALLALAFFARASVALGQDPPPEPPSGGAVPRGAAGAVVKAPDDKPAAPAAPAAPPAGFTMPKPRNYVAPVYPPEAEKAGLEAQVVVTIDLDTAGHVTKAVVAEPVGHGFDEAAIDAAWRLEFDPARKADGTPFAARTKYRYSFTLKKVEPSPTQAPSAEQRAQALFSGRVFAAGGDVPIAGAAVSLAAGSTMGLRPAEPGSAPYPAGKEATTDEKGAFVFKDLPPGKYTVVVSAPGYKPFGAEEILSAGEAVEVKYRLLPSGGALEVTVKGDRPPREVTKRTLERREIERIPGTNGDALKSLQSLPGVARPPGLAGLLIVRGSAPQDTQTFIDGTPVPLIYHFGGLSSVVPTEVLQKIDFYPGNFGSQFGRVQGGIVDVGLRDPKSEYHGIAQIDLIDARLLFEGPIPGLHGWSFLAAGRRSYVDAWLGPVLKAAGAGVTQAPVYYDYQFMVAKKPTPSSSFRVTFLGSDDAVRILLDKPAPGQPELSGNLGLHTAFQRLQMRYANDLGGGDRLNVTLAFGVDEFDFAAGPIFLKSNLRSVSGRAEYTKKLGRGVVLDAGLDMFGGYYDITEQLPPNQRPGSPPNGPFGSTTAVTTHLKGAPFQPAGYLEMEIAPDARSRIVPGVRLDYFNVTRQYDLSPRVNARYDIHKGFPRTTVKGGAGVYHQQPQFQGPQFQELNAPYGNPNLKSNRSIQYSLGAEQEITEQLEVSVEGFYKQLDSQVVSTPSGTSVAYTNNATGYVAGAEVLVKYKPDAHFFGWIAYTLSRSVRSDGPGSPQYLFQYDQPHILTVVGSYNFGNGWEFGARFRLVSGNLATPNVCDITSSTCNASRANALFNAASGTYTAIPLSGPFSERLPLFQQLDLRIDKRWKFKSWQLSTYLDVQNAYNNANVEALTYNFNYTARAYVTGLPLLPSVGIRGEL